MKSSASLLFLSIFWLAALEVGVAQPSFAVNEAMAQGDALYSHRAEAGSNQRAMAFYDQAIAADPSSAEAQWKAARAAWWAGTVLKKNSEKIPLFTKGIAHGREAVRLSPSSAPPHFWLASNQGSYGYAKGALTSLRLIGSIKSEMKEVLRLDPGYLSGGADRVLGILDYKVPGFVGGDKKRARVELERALAFNPAFPVTLYYLAEYWDVMGDKDLARDYLKKLKDLPPAVEDLPELTVIKDQTRQLTEKLK